jgi:hypothetical protein
MRRLPVAVLVAALLFASAGRGADEPGAEPESSPESAASGAETQPAADGEPMPGVSPAALADYDRPRTLGHDQEIALERTEITGNRELPKVLYIVPWQKSDPGALMGKPVNTLLDEVLMPLDREEFIRQVDYYSDLYDDDSVPPPPAAPVEAGIQSRKE